MRGLRSTGPIGPLFVAWGRAGISLVERAGDAAGFELDVMLRTGRPVTACRPDARRARRRHRAPARRGVAARPGARPVGGLTAFGGATLRKTMQIPWGEVRPYAWVAREIGRPRAVRAVGSGARQQPIALPRPLPSGRPCRRSHRRVRGGWTRRQGAMLRTEGVDPDALEALADDGIRYLGADDRCVFCFPTCRHAPHRGSADTGPVPARRGRPRCRLRAVRRLPAVGDGPSFAPEDLPGTSGRAAGPRSRRAGVRQ